MSIYLRRGIEYRDNDYTFTGEQLVKHIVQKHQLIVHDSDIRVVRVRQDGMYHYHDHHYHHDHYHCHDHDHYFYRQGFES
jgi:hypothetical protein